jgi:hypothetical protein
VYRTAPGRGDVFQCLLAYVLPNGVIYAQSVSGFAAATTGGTNRYATVRGTFRYQATGSPRVNLTLDLVS